LLKLLQSLAHTAHSVLAQFRIAHFNAAAWAADDGWTSWASVSPALTATAAASGFNQENLFGQGGRNLNRIRLLLAMRASEGEIFGTH